MADGPPAAPAVSVVIPTRDPGPGIGRCLAALEAQTLRHALEIIVVDDGSNNCDAIHDALKHFPRVRLTQARRRGIAAARNVGALAARGPIVCFTDDDCESEADWAAQLAEMIRGGADAGGGTTVPGRPENRYDAATQAIVNTVAEVSRARPSFLPGCNLACRRDVLLAVPFDERFTEAAEDREWCARLVRLGYRVGWEETAVIRHYQNLSFLSFWRKHLNYGRGAYRFMCSQGSGTELGPPVRYWNIARRSFEAGLRTGLLTCVAQLATAVGFAHELARAHALRSPTTDDWRSAARR
jgi:glycosyltransferase involved in cell wall biosynthesis